MSLIKWSPMSPFFDQPFDAMEKFLEDMRSSGMSLTTASQSLIPPVDMYETDSLVVIEMPMPGIDASKLDISIDNGILSVKGTNERKTEVDEKNYYRKEVRYGSVFRQIALPAKVLANKTEASYEKGILKISIPKAKEEGGAVKVQIKDQS
ncbi:Hsp20/alpha crystallin family protein [Patescibacteria group bacterium]|nr:Hsp20/alpha crystallin family protein [Patescibacteria group bacterium]